MDFLKQYSSDTSDDEEETILDQDKPPHEQEEEEEVEEVQIEDHHNLITTFIPFSQNFSQHQMNKIGCFLYIPWRPHLSAITRLNKESVKLIKQFPILKDNFKFQSTNIYPQFMKYHISVLNNFNLEPYKVDQFKQDLQNVIRSQVKIDPRLIGINEQEQSNQSALKSLLLNKQEPQPVETQTYINLRFEPKLSIFLSHTSNKLFVGCRIDVNHNNSQEFLTSLMSNVRHLVNDQYQEKISKTKTLQGEEEEQGGDGDGGDAMIPHVSFQIGEPLNSTSSLTDDTIKDLNSQLSQFDMDIGDIDVNINEILFMQLSMNKEVTPIKFNI